MSIGLFRFFVLAVVADFTTPLLLLLLVLKFDYNRLGLLAFGFVCCMWIFDLLSKRFFPALDQRFVNGWRYYLMEDLPRFHNFLNRLCEKSAILQLPGLLGVSGELNCFAGYRFPHGPLRRPVRVLLIGKPSLDFLTEKEIECVFAHELSHSLSCFAARIHSWAFDRSVIKWLELLSRILFPLRGLTYHFVMKRQSEDSLQRDEIAADLNAKAFVGEDFFSAAADKMNVLNSLYWHVMPPRLRAEIVKNPEVTLNYLGFVRHALTEAEFDVGKLYEDSIENRKSKLEIFEGSTCKLLDLNSGKTLFDPDSSLIDEQLNKDYQEFARDAWKAWHSFLVERESPEFVIQDAIAIRDRMLW